MITASLKTNLILKELGITRFSLRSVENKSRHSPIHIYKIQNITVLLNESFEEHDDNQKKLIIAIMNSTTLTNGQSLSQSSSADSAKNLNNEVDKNSRLIINFTDNEIKVFTKIPVINSAIIDELAANPQKKKQLWTSIKTLLNL